MPLAPLILIIEDHEDTRALYVTYLEYEGFRTIAADHATAGLALAHDERPHVIVTDLRLPDIDGFATIERLQADETLRDVPVVMLTGSVFPEEQRRAESLGVRAFLKKPCLPSDLVATLRQILAPAGC